MFSIKYKIQQNLNFAKYTLLNGKKKSRRHQRDFLQAV